MAKMFNRARMTVTSTGTGPLSLGVAVAGYQTFSSAGAQNGDSVSYAVEDGLKWEIGTGTYNSVAGTLSRTVTQSFDGTTYGTSPISVTTSAQVFISPLAADLQYGTSAGNLVQLDGSARLPAVDGSLVTALNASNISSGTIAAARLPSINLSTGVTGTLPFANGGTGLNSLTANRIPYATATDTLGTNANLTFNGTTLATTGLTVSGGTSLTSSSTNSTYLELSNTATDGRSYSIFSSGGGPSAAGTFGIYDNSSGGGLRLVLDASGNLGVGGSPSGKFDVISTSSIPYVNIITTATGSASVLSLLAGSGGEEAFCYKNALRFGQVTGVNGAGFSEKMRIHSNGYVGTGGIAPSVNLHIYEANTSVVAKELLRLDNPSTNSAYNGASLGIYQGASQYGRIRAQYTVSTGWMLNIGAGPTDDITIRSDNGWLGIGTYPSSRFHVYEPTANHAYVKIQPSNASYGSFLAMLNGGGNAIEHQVDTSGNYYLNVFGVAAGVLKLTAASSTANTLVLSAGRVGIGASPNYKLDVVATGGSGYSPTTARLQDSGNEAGLSITNSGTNGRTYSLLSTGGSSGLGAGNLVIADATASVTRLLIDSVGNVGIGYTSPSSYGRLAVNGNCYIPISSSYYCYTTMFGMGTPDGNGLQIFTNTNDTIRFGNRNNSGTFTENLRINGPILCLQGGSITATGTGIAFPATQSASADANTLDDYEEGTWTPSYTGSSSNPTVNYSYQGGWYIKVGRVVHCWLNIEVTSTSGGSGTLRISGFPFAASNYSWSAGSIGYWDSTAPTSIMKENGTTNAQMWLRSSSISGPITAAMTTGDLGPGGKYAYVSYQTA